MRVTKKAIIDKVRLLLDEIGTNDSGFESGKDDQELDTLIGESALEALRFINTNAPRELLEADARLEVEDFTQEDGLLPDTKIGLFGGVKDFLRLVSVRCSAWSKPVFEPIMEGTPEWEKLRNKYLTGTPEYPEVGVSKRLEISPAGQSDVYDIRLYCLPVYPDGGKPASVELDYMARPAWAADKDGEYLRVSYLLQDAYHYYLAYLVLMALGDSRHTAALNQALPLMGLDTQNTATDGE